MNNQTNLELKLNEKPVNQGLVQSLPDNKFHKQEQEGKKNDEDGKCLVCMTEYEEGESIKTLPCFHKYHTECIQDWFKRQNFCPICRHEIK